MANLHDSDMEKNDKKITWSKGSLLVTGIIFIAVVVVVLFLYINGSVSSMADVSVLGICVSVSGAIFGSNLCWYSKKAASENQYKFRLSLFSDVAKIRLEYNKEMMIAMEEHKMTQEDIDMIDSTGDMDEMMDNALSSVISNLDDNQNDSDSPNSLDSFSL